MNEDFYEDCRCEADDGMSGNNIDICVNKNDCEIRADLVIQKRKSVRIWGQVLTCDCEPVKHALVTLLRIDQCDCGLKRYEGVAFTITDQKGFYQFDICGLRDEAYKLLVCKPQCIKKKLSPCEELVTSEYPCDC